MKKCDHVSFILAALALVCGSVSLDGQQFAVASASTQPNTGAPSSPQSAAPNLQQRYPRYVVQLSDVLLLSFPLSPEFDQSVTVQPDGYVSLKNSGSLHAQGLTVPELIGELKKAYAGVLHEPIINVDLVDFQKPFFTVSGQVGKPGQYELRADITVAEGLAVAGGMTPTAKTQVFLFHRTSQDWFEVRQVNMKDILNGKNVNEDATLKPGDMIYVPEKFIASFRKYVPYSFNAGAYLNPTIF